MLMTTLTMERAKMTVIPEPQEMPGKKVRSRRVLTVKLRGATMQVATLVCARGFFMAVMARLSATSAVMSRMKGQSTM